MSNITINSLPTASTIDAVQDIIPIYTNSATATQGINRNTLLGLASAPIGSTDSQTMSNKTLTAPTINGATLSGTLSGTYTIGGTPTFPSSVVQLTSTQTLTNKTLTSPTINSPTITNATISADTITGYTTSGSGTIYGLGIASGGFTGNITVGGTLGVTGAVTLSSTLGVSGIIKSNSNPVWQYLNSAQITSGVTTTSSSFVAISGLSVGVTIPTGVTAVRVTVFARDFTNSTAGDYATIGIFSGATSGTLTAQLSTSQTQSASGGGSSAPVNCQAIIKSPSSGSIYYTAALMANAGSGTASIEIGSAYPMFILVECC